MPAVAAQLTRQGDAQTLRPGALLGRRSQRHEGSRSARHELAYAEHVARADRQLGTLRRIAVALGCMSPPRRRGLPLAHLPTERPPEDMPALVVVLIVCGTRGDVQPFIAMGLKLQEAGCGGTLLLRGFAVDEGIFIRRGASCSQSSPWG